MADYEDRITIDADQAVGELHQVSTAADDAAKSVADVGKGAGATNVGGLEDAASAISGVREATQMLSPELGSLVTSLQGVGAAGGAVTAGAFVLKEAWDALARETAKDLAKALADVNDGLALTNAEQAKATLADLVGVIQDSGGPLAAMFGAVERTVGVISEADDRFAAFKRIIEENPAAAAAMLKAYGDQLGLTNEQQQRAAELIRAQTDQTVALKLAEKDYADEVRLRVDAEELAAKAAEARVQRQQDALEAYHNAADDTAKAAQGVAAAQQSVADAQERLRRAREAVARQAYTDAERDYQAAIRDTETAARNLTRAQDALTTARKREADAARGVADAQVGVDRAARHLAEAQADLAKAQAAAGDSADKQATATNRVADAQLRLVAAALSVRDAQLEVVDAQEDLDRQRRRGGVNQERRIADAQRVLERARLREAEATNAQQDAQQTLAEATVDYARSIDGLPDNLDAVESATRQVENAQDSLTDATRRVTDANARLADAHGATVAAQQAVAQATWQAQTAAAYAAGELRNLQAATAAYNPHATLTPGLYAVRDAERAVEDQTARLTQKQADYNAQVQRTQDLLRAATTMGAFWPSAGSAGAVVNHVDVHVNGSFIGSAVEMGRFIVDQIAQYTRTTGGKVNPWW